jgi:hypothetical protein
MRGKVSGPKERWRGGGVRRTYRNVNNDNDNDDNADDHSFCFLSYNSSIDSYKASSLQSAI